MNLKSKKGSISMFVLVGLLFMSAFLIISYAYNVNKSKIAKEQFNMISDIYSHKDGNANAYDRAYTALRKKNKQILTATIEDSSTLELDKTYEEDLVNYRIYGNSIQEGTTSLSLQSYVPVQSTGDLVTDISDIYYDKYKIPIKITNETGESLTTNIYLDEPLRKIGEYEDYIDLKNNIVVRYVYKKTFTGTEANCWYQFGTSATEVTSGVYYVNAEELGTKEEPKLLNESAICTNFIYQKGISIHTQNDDLLGYFTVKPTTLPPYIAFKVPYTDLNSWKTFLESQYNQGTPLQVYIQLIEPNINEEIELPELKMYEDYTKIEVLTEVAPSKIEVEYEGYTLD